MTNRNPCSIRTPLGCRVVYEIDIRAITMKDKPMSREDKKYHLLDDGIKMLVGHVQLPFKTDDPKLPNNNRVVMLHQLKIKLLKKPKFVDQYNPSLIG